MTPALQAFIQLGQELAKSKSLTWDLPYDPATGSIPKNHWWDLSSLVNANTGVQTKLSTFATHDASLEAIARFGGSKRFASFREALPLPYFSDPPTGPSQPRGTIRRPPSRSSPIGRQDREVESGSNCSSSGRSRSSYRRAQPSERTSRRWSARSNTGDWSNGWHPRVEGVLPRI